MALKQVEDRYNAMTAAERLEEYGHNEYASHNIDVNFRGTDEQLCNALNEVAKRGNLTTKAICSEAARRLGASVINGGDNNG
jgi:hypothetical protein